jgi:hypothetical protein
VNGQQFEAKRRSLYLTRDELAGFLQVKVEKVERWEANQEEIPVSVQHGMLILEFKLQEDYETGPDEYRQLVNQRHREWDREELLRRRAAKKRQE